MYKICLHYVIKQFIIFFQRIKTYCPFFVVIISFFDGKVKLNPRPTENSAYSIEFRFKSTSIPHMDNKKGYLN